MQPNRRRTLRGLPMSVWALGFTSLFMDVSSELIHALLPLYLSTVLGASMVTIGFIEGIAESVAQITKLFSGWLSDRLGRRKPLALVGYALAAFTKPVFPLAATVGWVFGARLVDRIAKGIRGAPRDALIADLVPERQRGAAYGLRQALDSVGALLGPLAAIGLMALLAEDIRAVLWVAVLPATLAVLVLGLGVREPEGSEHAGRASRAAPVRLADLRRMPAGFWTVVTLGSVLTLARFSEAFLILRAADVGFALALAPVVMIAMNLVYAAASYPAGILADRVGARGLLLSAVLVLVIADLLLALVPTRLGVIAGTAFWGLHMALSQGLLSKMVADAAPAALRGSAFGLFNLATGLALLGASVIAGWLWQGIGAQATFLVGAGFAAITALGLVLASGSGGPGGAPQGRPSRR